jgi:hypothetical protein
LLLSCIWEQHSIPILLQPLKLFIYPHWLSSFTISEILQALKVIKKLIEQFPIKRAPLTVRFTAPKSNLAGLMEKLDEWNAIVISKDESANQSSLVSLNRLCLCEPLLCCLIMIFYQIVIHASFPLNVSFIN